MSDPWADFMAARLRLIHMWAGEGKSSEQICAELNHHDSGQIRLLLMTDPTAPIPVSVYEDLKEAIALLKRWHQDYAKHSHVSRATRDYLARQKKR